MTDELIESYAEVPEYAVVDKTRKLHNEMKLSMTHKQTMGDMNDSQLDLKEIEVPAYAVVDKTKKSRTSHSVKESSTFSAAKKKSVIPRQDLEHTLKNPSLATQDAEDMYIGMHSTDPTPDTKPTRVKSIMINKIYSHIQREYVYVVIAVIVITAFTVCLLAAFIEISQLKENKQPNDDDVNIEQLIANYQEKHGQNLSNPALPCVYNIYQLAPVTPSNYCMNCDITWQCGNITGGWMRVAELDMKMDNSHCPAGLTLQNSSTLRTCHKTYQAGCSSVIYSTNNITYSKVSGKIKAYQYGNTNGFSPFKRGNGTINDPYVDGISLTYGQPRQHIWTFAADNNEEGSPSNCPCINSKSLDIAKIPPAFVGTDYFCDTGRENDRSMTLVTDDPLWDGAGCGPNNTCCGFNNPPWFYKQLPVPTAEAIEMRVCRDQDRFNEDIAIEAITIYVHP